ncbi:MAG: hypothetical protein A2580_00985 [Hydrogenophilales bacterium RIFOXYD1_FULL_62_11]|nr:MAG: hypothetical protein A2580_00985 [Hydrogenophilales bacterium RIFOXYD1_FULL_62_11]
MNTPPNITPDQKGSHPLSLQVQHQRLLARTLFGASLAQDEEDQEQLRDQVRQVIAELDGWIDAYRSTIANCLSTPGRAGEAAGAYSLCEKASQFAARFKLIRASSPIPGVQLAKMYQVMVREPWPAA